MTLEFSQEIFNKYSYQI